MCSAVSWRLDAIVADVNQQTSPQVIRRRRKVVGIGAVGIVLAAALSSAFVWPGFADSHPAAVLTQAPERSSEVMNPDAAVPELEPAARVGEQTELVKAIPDLVAGFVQTDIAGAATWTGGEKAIESWQFTYIAGGNVGADTILVDVGQFENAADSEAFFSALLNSASEPIAEGDVFVGDERAGRFALVEGPTTSAEPSEQGVLYWRNGTVVLRAEGPITQLQQFYTEFPL